jgi:[calcium/calmodulin-dependent protein kinase] kinase
MERRRKLEQDAEDKRQQVALEYGEAPPARPPSPDDLVFNKKQEEARRAQSSSSVNSTSIASLTSPSDMTSPISSDNLGSTEQFSHLPSVPSLPALISGASSVSADPEGEMLTLPGVVQHPETAHGTPETLTPPSLSKQVSAEVGTPIAEPLEDAIVLAHEEDEGYNGDGDNVDDEDSDSDEGLTMTRRKPKAQSPIESRIDLRKIERRDTNASVGSTETAKKLVMDT